MGIIDTNPMPQRVSSMAKGLSVLVITVLAANILAINIYIQRMLVQAGINN
jgi:hypothetical protein